LNFFRKVPASSSSKLREFVKFAKPPKAEAAIFQWLASGVQIAFICSARGVERNTMLKIRRSTNGKIVFTLSGRIEIEDVAELQRLLALELSDRSLALDLADVTLVDREAVKFLAHCEGDSIQLENCPPYIREWIQREKPRDSRRRRQ
jgi:hypothetical protein